MEITAENVQKEKKKLSPKALVGIIAAALLVLIGGTVAAITLVANNPQNIAGQAITKLLKQQSNQISGTIDLSVNTISTENFQTDTATNSYSAIHVDLSTNRSGIENSTTATVTVKGAISDLTFKFDEVFLKNGDLYLKTTSLTDMISSLLSQLNSMLEAAGLDEECTVTEEEDCLEHITAKSYAALYSEIFDRLGSFAQLVNGTWWKISLPEVAQEFGLATDFASTYNCAVGALDQIVSDSDTLVSTYEQHPFVVFERSDKTVSGFVGTAYQASLDETQFKSFATSFADQLKPCFTTDDTTPNVDGLMSIVSKLNAQKYYLDIDQDSHEIRGFYTNFAQNYYTFAANLRISNAPAQVLTPESARPASDLFAPALELFQSFSSLFSF